MASLYTLLIPPLRSEVPTCFTSVLQMVMLAATVPTEQTSTASFPPSLLKTKSIMGSTITLPERTPTKLTQLHSAEVTSRQLTARVVSICLLRTSYYYVRTRRKESCGIWTAQCNSWTVNSIATSPDKSPCSTEDKEVWSYVILYILSLRLAILCNSNV